MAVVWKDSLFLYSSFVYDRVIVLGEIANNLLDLFDCWLFHCAFAEAISNMVAVILVHSLSITGT